MKRYMTCIDEVIIFEMNQTCLIREMLVNRGMRMTERRGYFTFEIVNILKREMFFFFFLHAF